MTQANPGDPASVPGPSGYFSGVPRTVRRFILLVFFTAVGYGYLQILISAYLPEIGFDAGSVGWILGANGLAVVIGSVPLGLYADRKGKKRILFIGFLCFPLTLLIFALTSDFLVLLAAGAVAGLAEGAFLSTWNALIADMTTPESREKAFSLSFVVATAAFGVGYAVPLALPVLASAADTGLISIHRDATIILAILSVISPVGTARILRGYTERIKKGPAEKRGSLAPLWRFSTINAVLGLGAGFIIPLIGTWFFFRFAISDTYSGPLLAVANLTIAFAAVGSPLLSKKLGTVRAIVMSQGTSTVFMFAMALTPVPLLAGALYVVRAALMNMASPLSDSFLMGIVPVQQRSLASAINSLLWRLPNSATTIAGGAIMASGNYSLPIYLATALYVTSIASFYLVFKNVKPSA